MPTWIGGDMVDSVIGSLFAQTNRTSSPQVYGDASHPSGGVTVPPPEPPVAVDVVVVVMPPAPALPPEPPSELSAGTQSFASSMLLPHAVANSEQARTMLCFFMEQSLLDRLGPSETVISLHEIDEKIYHKMAVLSTL
jgi:hypothetical protein